MFASFFHPVCSSPAYALRTLAAFGFAALALFGARDTARSDEILTLELPPSQGALDLRAAEKARAAQEKARTSVVPSSRRAPSRGRLPSRGGSVERVVGRLGQLAWQTPIFRRRSPQSQALTTAPAGTYVAIQDTVGNWYGVLMADGSTGWLTRQNVNLLEYQVVSSGNPVWPTGGAEQEDVYPRGSAPYFAGDQQALMQEAYKYLGVRYVWGGNTMNGVDCSGFVKNIFGVMGYSLPRLGSDQMAYGVPVPFDQLQPGDRLYFDRRTERLGVKHTGLYLGNGYFIHASSSRKGVGIDSLMTEAWRRRLVCARR